MKAPLLMTGAEDRHERKKQMQHFSDREFTDLRYSASDKVADMSFDNCTFRDCSFDTCTFERCVFHDCTFISCGFICNTAVNTDMRFCSFRRCMLLAMSFMSFVNDEYIRQPVTSLEECRISNCLFNDMSFPRYDFGGNQFSRCEFTECDLREAVFAGCSLGGSSFSNSDLRKADFRRAEGYVIDIFNNKLRGARFSTPEALDLLAGLNIEID